MSKKKTIAPPETTDMFEGLSSDEQKEVIARFRRLALTLRNAATEFADIIDTLDSPKPTLARERKDENEEPTFKFLARVRIPKDISLTKRIRAYAASYGFTEAEISKMFKEFVEYYQRVGTKWMDWTLVAYKWYRTEAQRRMKDQQTAPTPRTSKSLQEFR